MQLDVFSTIALTVKLTGIVTGVIDAKTDGKQHFAIFNLKIGTDKHRVVCRFGTIEDQPSVDDIWHVTGEHEDDQRYGPQFIATAGERKPIDVDTDQTLVCDYIQQSKLFSGIGKNWVEKMNKAFPDSLVKTLETADTVTFIKHPRLKMPETLAESLLSGWRQCSTKVKLLKFLNKKQIPRALVSKLTQLWGRQVIENLEANPYRLLPLMPAKNAIDQWRTIDKIAHAQFSVQKDDPRRALAAIEACLYQAYDTNGHMALPIKNVQRVLDDENIKYTVAEVARQHGQFTLVIHQELKLVQSLGHLALEKITAKRLNDIAYSPDSYTLTYHESLLLEFIEQARIKKQVKKFKLDDNQINAVKFVMLSRLSLITGGGGTGKTTIITAILHQHEARGKPVWLLAPTGKAARRLAEETDHKTETVFSFVLQIGELIRSGELQQTLFIIDEASMLDTPSIYTLLKLLPNNCRLCLVGDVKKMEPMGPGLVFHQLANDPNLCVNINRSYRQDGVSDLHKFCDAIGRQDLKLASAVLYPYAKGTQSDVTWRQTQSSSVRAMVKSAQNTWYDLYKVGKEPQLLAATRKVCDQINQEQQKIRDFKKKLPSREIYERKFIEGDPVIYGQNSRELAISNGSVGKICEIYSNTRFKDGRQCIVKIEFEIEGVKYMTEKECLFMDLAYCITTHKSQGSQYDNAIVILDADYLIDNSWLYTAVSLARHKVVLVGDLEFIKDTINSPPNTARRYIGSPINIQETK